MDTHKDRSIPTHTLPHALRHTHTHMHTRTHMRTRMHAGTHARGRSDPTYIRTHTHKPSHTHIHTHTHLRMQACPHIISYSPKLATSRVGKISNLLPPDSSVSSKQETRFNHYRTNLKVDAGTAKALPGPPETNLQV